ncbi:hypothetical protein E0D98_22000 [Escherichia sp. KCJ4928]|nr:hypothetical protein E0D98_22000 [Escherichia sp. KCJ4928]
MCISSPETNSWSVIYRKNSGEDINITSLTFKNSLLAARWICPYISRHLLSLNPLQARCRRYSRGER